MERETFGKRIANLRRENGMTQLELAEKMGVTDKAVSKWERNLSLPDAGSLPRLAEIFQVSVDELMQGKAEENEKPRKYAAPIVSLALKGVALAMGVAVAVLSALNKVETGAAISMLGIGLACLAAAQLSKPEK